MNVMKLALGRIFTEAPVNCGVTVPGNAVVFAAFAAGMLMAFGAITWGRSFCAKWKHDPRQRCIICGQPGVPKPARNPAKEFTVSFAGDVRHPFVRPEVDSGR